MLNWLRAAVFGNLYKLLAGIWHCLRSPATIEFWFVLLLTLNLVFLTLVLLVKNCY